MSEEVLQAAGDIAYWQRRAEYAESDAAALKQAISQYLSSDEVSPAVLLAAAQVPAGERLLSERADLRAVLTDLVNQLTLLTRDDESYLWRIGGRPLDEAYKAAKRAMEGGEKK